MVNNRQRTVILWQVSGKEQACLVATGLEIMSDNHMGGHRLYLWWPVTNKNKIKQQIKGIACFYNTNKLVD